MTIRIMNHERLKICCEQPLLSFNWDYYSSTVLHTHFELDVLNMFMDHCRHTWASKSPIFGFRTPLHKVWLLGGDFPSYLPSPPATYGCGAICGCGTCKHFYPGKHSLTFHQITYLPYLEPFQQCRTVHSNVPYLLNCFCVYKVSLWLPPIMPLGQLN